MSGLTLHYVEASCSDSWWIDSPPCSPKKPSGKCNFLMNSTTCSPSMCNLGGKLVSLNLLLMYAISCLMSSSENKIIIQEFITQIVFFPNCRINIFLCVLLNKYS